MLPSTNFTGIGSEYDNPHVGRCGGVARRWAARGGQEKESQPVVVHNLGPQQKTTFLPWTGVLKGGLGSIRGVVRTKMLGLPELFRVARLLEDVVELVSFVCHLGPGSLPAVQAVLPRLVAKPWERGFLCARIEWWSVWWPQRF